jgi:hypothetical protein
VGMKKYVIKELVSGNYLIGHQIRLVTKVIWNAKAYSSKKAAKATILQMLAQSETKLWLEIVTVYTN